MTDTIERQADALLLAVVETNGGDLRAAFAVLCARVTVEDVTGETFEAALARAVRKVFSHPRIVFSGVEPPRIDRGAADV